MFYKYLSSKGMKFIPAYISNERELGIIVFVVPKKHPITLSLISLHIP
jgi:hypothetical protein